LFEHADPRRGHHPDWDSCIFNYERSEVRSFLLSSANFFIDRYHIDGLRVDAVASMLYLDYSRADGEWVPNENGGNENLGAVAFLRQLTGTLYGTHPGVQIIAEESTAWPGVTMPADHGGLGFGYKWDMGWMHDTLAYMERDPVHRRHHGRDLTFRSIYAGSENFLLPLSHDEVVHGKGSLVDKMPGDTWQRLANLRLLLGYQWATPGKKLLFMGGEFAQQGDWNHEKELDWALLTQPENRGVQHLVRRLNQLYRTEPALHEGDCTGAGLEWLVADDTANTVFAFWRLASGHRPILVIANFTPVPRQDYRVGVPVPGTWLPLLETDSTDFGGSGIGSEPIVTDVIGAHGHDQSLSLVVGPLAITFLAPIGNNGEHNE
jgi:1,4-alpha-glucan branching enzyme